MTRTCRRERPTTHDGTNRGSPERSRHHPHLFEGDKTTHVPSYTYFRNDPLRFYRCRTTSNTLCTVTVTRLPVDPSPTSPRPWVVAQVPPRFVDPPGRYPSHTVVHLSLFCPGFPGPDPDRRTGRPRPTHRKVYHGGKVPGDERTPCIVSDLRLSVTNVFCST